jgi:hypothetical protein
MYRPSDYGTERAARMIARVREHLTSAEISDLIGTRTEPWEHDWYAAYVHNDPALISGFYLRDAIDAYTDCGPEPHGRSAYDEDRPA